MAARELTVTELEQASTVLIPMLQQALRPEFESMHKRISDKADEIAEGSNLKIAALRTELDKRLTVVESQVGTLSRNQGKALLGLSWFMTLAAMVSAFAKDWIIKGYHRILGH